MENNNAASLQSNILPFNLSDEEYSQAWDTFMADITHLFADLPPPLKKLQIRIVAESFFEKETPKLENWLRSNGFLK